MDDWVDAYVEGEDDRGDEPGDLLATASAPDRGGPLVRPDDDALLDKAYRRARRHLSKVAAEFGVANLDQVRRAM